MAECIHAHGAARAVHDLSDLGVPKAHHDVQQNGFGLVGGEGADECECTLRVVVGDHLAGDVVGGSRERLEVVGAERGAPRLVAHPIDDLVTGDGEQPRAEGRLRSVEGLSAACELEPGLARGVLGPLR